jgi:cellulose synthase/poly-beta-1,6-N-acetylglucosamine synthase-like glycosyltransferase
MPIHILTALYIISASALALFSLGQGILLVQYWRTRHQTIETPKVSPQALPSVTVQLPLYNEASVSQRLLAAICGLDYPRERLHIQLLDDSSDETSTVLAELIPSYQAQGFQIEHVRRAKREGYKAGALQVGLKTCQAEFVVIFDADFVPAPDFLQRTLPHLLADDGLAVVQTRWGHLNADENWLTQAQALAVDGHFVVEQTARNRSAWFIPFNGSGGIWRVSAIHDSGGWLSRTLTEDLDLSYRAQLRGWRALYLPDIVVPGELPPQLAAYRQQQARWAQGDIQCLAIFTPLLWRANLPRMVKLMAIHHLFQYLAQPLMLLLLLLTPPLLAADALSPALAPLGVMGFIPPLLYAISQYRLYPNWARRMAIFPVLLLVVTGMVFANSWAVLKALMGQADEFKRTPKYADQWQSSRYALKGHWRYAELSLALYAILGVWIALRNEPAAVPYLLIYVASLGTIVLWDALDQWRLASLS